MADMKEKLVELMQECKCYEAYRNPGYCAGFRKETEKCAEITELPCALRQLADHLVANGVTVSDTNVGKWISVKDRLPEDVCGKDREQIVVLVRTKSGRVSQCARCADYDCITDETFTRVEWIKSGKFYWSKNKLVTHWMPLPEPPKGE